METKNFSIVTYLEGDELKKVRSLQERLGELTGSRKCLDDWQPHITIGDGPRVDKESFKTLESKIAAFTTSHELVQAKIKGFGGTTSWKGATKTITPYVLWLEVEVNKQLLTLWEEFRDQVTSRYGTWLPRTKEYKPHITLAFADLNEEGYNKGLDFLAMQNYDSEFVISSISLVECYGEGNMTSKEYRRYNLSS